MPSERVSDLFERVLELKPELRHTFLVREAPDEPKVREEVMRLLDAHNPAQDPLESGMTPDVLKRVLSPSQMTEFLPGANVGNFIVQRCLGKGGSGAVYLARDRSLEREVALKITRDLGQEGRILSPLDHPNIVKVYSESTDHSQGLRLLCMQYIAGASLETVLKEAPRGRGQALDGPTLLAIIYRASPDRIFLDPLQLTGRERVNRLDAFELGLWLGIELCEALSHAHAQGILHLDIKPANIILNQYGRPFLVDFGVSLRMNRESVTGGAFGGTFHYMAPEQAAQFERLPTSPQELDERTDLFSLARALSEVTDLTRTQLPPTNALALFEETLTSCLSADKNQRTASARELSNILQSCMDLHRLARLFARVPTFLKLSAQTWFEFAAKLGVALFAWGSWPILLPLFGGRSPATMYAGYRIEFPWLSSLCLLLAAASYLNILRLRRTAFRAMSMTPLDLKVFRAKILMSPLYWGTCGLAVAAIGIYASFQPLLQLSGFRPTIAHIRFIKLTAVSDALVIGGAFLWSQSICMRSIYWRLWRAGTTPDSTALGELAVFSRRLHVLLSLWILIPMIIGVLACFSVFGGKPRPVLSMLMLISGGFGGLVALCSQRILSSVTQNFESLSAR